MIQQIQDLLGDVSYLPWLPEVLAAVIFFFLVVLIMNFLLSFISDIFKF